LVIATVSTPSTPTVPALEIGRRLRRLRKARGLSCRDLGERLGLSGVDVAQIEAGNGRVDLDTLVLILRELHASAADLSG
jgi:transcriptional regulator with XRE-family HTH domain